MTPKRHHLHAPAFQRISASIACLLALAISPIRAEQALKVCTVDVQALFKNHPKVESTQQQINAERAGIQKDNQERTAAVNKCKEEIKALYGQSQDPGMGEEKRKELQQKMQEKNQEGMALEQERQAAVQRHTAALNEKMVNEMKKILAEINATVAAKAKADGYNLVLDKGGLSTSQVPVVLFSDIDDLTEAVQAEINKQGKAPAKGGKD